MSELFQALEKHNYWNGEQIKVGYRRQDYLFGFGKSIGNNLIKVLVGQRRTGKSYLLRQIMDFILNEKGVKPENILYFNKEFIDFETIKESDDLHSLLIEYREKLNPQGKTYLFFDEIQSISGWEKVVNSYSQDPKNDTEIFITGSNSTMLSGELATYLSGRYISYTIFPFSYAEFLDIHNKVRSRESLILYLRTGGLPEMIHLDDDEIRGHYVESLRDTILLRDIVQRYRIKDAWLLENLFNYLTSEAGHLFSINNIINYFNSQKIKTNHETVTNYLYYLSQTFVIHEVARYHIKAKEVLGGLRKYYLNDLAYRNYSTMRVEGSLSTNLENMVFLHYLREGYKIFVGTFADKEIDFITERGNERQYIQVTYMLADESVISREFGNLERIKDHFPKKVISLDDISLGNKNGIEHVCAWDL